MFPFCIVIIELPVDTQTEFWR